MNASLCIYGIATESDKCDLINEVKRLLQSSNTVYINFGRVRTRGDSNAFIVAKQDSSFEDPSWRLEVWVTIKDLTTMVSSEGFDISDIANEAWGLKTSEQVLKQLQFEQIDVFDYGDSFIDSIYARENIENADAVAEIIFELIQKFTSLPDDDPLYDPEVDWSLVEKIEKLEGRKRKIVRAYLQVLISDIDSNIPNEKLGWRTRNKIAKELPINRQDIYKYNKEFVDLYNDELLARRPYVGPGRKWKDCWEYRINCNHETVQKIKFTKT
jgi:hypothetical protein